MKHLTLFLVACVFKATLISAQCEADHVIALADFYFAPNTLTIAPGESVAFINAQGTHNINGITSTLTGNSFGNPVEFFLPETTGTVDGACMGVITFDVPGVYSFDCSIGLHAQLGMTGQITVDAYTVSDLLLETQLNFEEQGVTAWQSSWAFISYYGQWSPETDVLSGTDSFTVFAPTDAAVEAVGELMNLGQFDLLAFYDMPDALAYHIVPGIYLASDFFDGMELVTLQGQSLSVAISDAGVQINGAQVVLEDIEADNGVVHVINQTLAPSGYPGATVLDVIMQSPDHTLFEEAVFSAYLDDDLRGQPILNDNEAAPGPFTVFAPTDEALTTFALNNGFDSVEDLLSSQYMDEIVQLHVVESEWLAASFFDNQGLLSYSGELLIMGVSEDGIDVDGAPIVLPDQLAYNGVVHSLGEVIPFAFPNPVGTCGTWTLNLYDNAGDGWDSPILVQENGNIIGSEFLAGGYSSSYAFAVNQSTTIDLIHVGFGGYPGESYELVDGEGTVVWDWSGSFSSSASGSIFGLQPCRPEPTCGYVEVTLYDEYGDGWDYGSLSIYADGQFITSITSVLDNDLYFEFDEAHARIAVDEGETLNFVFSGGYFPEECGYTVVGPNGEVLVDQNTSGMAPIGNVEVVPCATEPNAVDESLGPLMHFISPNPTRGDLSILGIAANVSWTLNIADLQGKLLLQTSGLGASVLNVQELPAGLYITTLTLADGTSFTDRLIKQ